MITRKVITVNIPALGQTVELREPAAIDMIAASQGVDDKMSGFRQLALMLFVDGHQYTAEEISQWGFSVVGPLFNAMNDLMPSSTEGNG